MDNKLKNELEGLELVNLEDVKKVLGKEAVTKLRKKVIIIPVKVV